MSKRIGIALKHEERRCGYISEQTLTMTSTHDDGYVGNQDMAFQTILKKCTLAENIKKMYEHLCTTGMFVKRLFIINNFLFLWIGLVNIRINRWIPLSFCLPQKVHQWHLRGKIIEPEDIDKYYNSIRYFE